jgi:DNA-binding CsgD family transcriptional regulator
MSKTKAKRPTATAAPASSDRRSPTVSLAQAESVFGLTVAVARERHTRLTAREVQVAGLMASGKPNRQIAEGLGISPKTLDIHRANLMHKLEARTTADVANLVNLLRLADIGAGEA